MRSEEEPLEGSSLPPDEMLAENVIPHEVINPFVVRLDALNSTYDKVKVHT